MSRAVTIGLVVNAVLAIGWVSRMAPAEPVRWPLVDSWLDAVNLQFVRDEPFYGEGREPWTPTQVLIRAENNELNLVPFGSLEAPETWRPNGPPVVYVYPDPDVTVGDVVAALDKLNELVPKNTIVITELR